MTIPQPVRAVYRGGTVIVVYCCPACRRPSSATVPRRAFEDWDGITPPRQAFPGLDDGDYEALASGRHRECAAQADEKEHGNA